MNKLGEEEARNQIQSRKINSKKKNNKKAKNPSETTDELAIQTQDRPNDALGNTIHLNNINSNLTNGSSEHCDENSRSTVKRDSDIAPSEVKKDVHCNNSASNHSEETSSHMDAVRNMVEEALEKLENALNLQEKPKEDVEIISYESELQMPEIMRIIQKDLSEPYSIYTYRYFIHNWPKLCFLAMHEGRCIGAIVCKLDMHRNVVKRGYIAMLAVDENYRKRKIGSRLVQKAIQVMIDDNADEVVLETEITNKSALKLYENLGFVRDKRLFRYYLNGVDALRLKLWLR